MTFELSHGHFINVKVSCSLVLGYEFYLELGQNDTKILDPRNFFFFLIEAYKFISVSVPTKSVCMCQFYRKEN